MTHDKNRYQVPAPLTGNIWKITAKVGQTVAKGDVVGNAGSTGRSTGPHLHYEIRVNSRPIDPMTFIRAGEQLTPVL